MSTLNTNSSSRDNSLMRGSMADGSEGLPEFSESDFYLSLNDVEMGAQIGQGAFSKVYIARHMGELVAVKKQHRTGQNSQEDYLLRELSVLKHFEHENLLTYIGASMVKEADGKSSDIYIVTELAEYGDLLAVLLSPHELGWKFRVNILLDAAVAIEFLHSKSLIHRDIKSPNFLISRGFTCKLADFGMARQVATNMTIVGTDAYMAPELMFDEPYSTPADMFSFGIVMWECLHRRKAGPDGIAAREASSKFTLDIDKLKEGLAADAPQSLITLAEQLCEYEPDTRPTSDDTVMWLSDLSNELDDEPQPDVTAIDFEALFTSDGKPRRITSPGGTTVTPPATQSRPLPTPPQQMNSSGDVGHPPPVPSRRESESIAGAGAGVPGRKPSRPRGASHAPITRSGYLHKKGKSGLKSFQTRWFVLEGTRLIWYKESKNYPKEPRGFLELRGCFIVRGRFFRWKILSADGAADQEDYNRELSADSAPEMEAWLAALQEAIDQGDTVEGIPHTRSNSDVLKPGDEGELPFDNRKSLLPQWDAISSGGFYVGQTVEKWLEELQLRHLYPVFASKGYTDLLMILEMGLVAEDLDFLGIKAPNERGLLKMAARGLLQPTLTAVVSGFFNFGEELVYRLDSRWLFLRASTFFRLQDFEELHRKIKAAMKDSKLVKMLPVLPAKPTQSLRGSVHYASQMARLQQALNKYTQKLVLLIGTREPFFTMLCGHLDLLPPDPARLPDRSDDFLARMALHLDLQDVSNVGVATPGAAANDLGFSGGLNRVPSLHLKRGTALLGFAKGTKG